MLQIFCVPKLKQICADAGEFPGQPLFYTADFVINHAWIILGFVVLNLITLELISKKWQHYRRFVLSFFVFLVNSAAIVSISGMFIVALLVAPALLRR